MMPGIWICSQRKKKSLDQIDQTTMFNTPKSIFLAAIFDSCVSTDLSALPKKWFDRSEVRIEEQGEYVRSVSASVSVDPTHN